MDLPDPRSALEDEAETVVFDSQVEIHGLEGLRKLLKRFRAAHDIRSLASKLDSDGSVPGDLKEEFDRLAASFTKKKVIDLFKRFAGASKAKKSSDDVKFAANLSLLKEYKEEEGHCNVPQG